MPLLIDRHGILRSAKCARGREGSRTTCWFPLTAEERITSRRLFLRHLLRPITLQAGVTITTVMDALAPWQGILSDLIGIDFAAWHTACRRPIDSDRRAPWEKVEIAALVKLTATPTLTTADLRNILASLAEGGGRPIGQPSDKYEIEVGWNAYGVNQSSGHCAFLGFSPAAWAHVPVALHPDAELRDDTLLLPGALSHDQALLNPANPLLTCGKWRGGGVRPRGRVTVTATLFETILNGLLQRACTGRTPDTAKAMFDETKRDIQRQTVVINQTPETPPAEPAASAADTAAKVIFAPGCFGAWIDQIESDIAATEALVAALEPRERQALTEVDEA